MLAQLTINRFVELGLDHLTPQQCEEVRQDLKIFNCFFVPPGTSQESTRELRQMNVAAPYSARRIGGPGRWTMHAGNDLSDFTWQRTSTIRHIVCLDP